MTDAESNTIASRYRPPGAVVRGILFVIAVAGLGVSGFLLYEGVRQGAPLPGCGPGTGCDAVLNSEWSVILGLPAALPAVVVYLAVLGALLHIGAAAPPGRQRGAWRVLILAAMMLFAAAAWFSYLQYFVIGAICKYCMAAHACGVLLAAVILFNAPIGRRKLLPDDPDDPLLLAPAGAVALVLAGLLSVGAMAAAQFAFRPPTMIIERFQGHQPLPPDTAEVTYLRMQTSDQGIVDIAIPRGEYPTLGPADAPVMIVYLFDYTCPHCRDMHATLRAMRGRYGDRLAVMSLPTPLNTSCNPHVGITERRHLEACALARIALRVWQADPTRFAAIDNWLFEHEAPRTAAEARQYARRLLGEDRWSRVADSDWPDRVLEESTGLFGLLEEKNKKLPVIRIRDYRGRGDDPDILGDFLAELLGDPPR